MTGMILQYGPDSGTENSDLVRLKTGVQIGGQARCANVPCFPPAAGAGAGVGIGSLTANSFGAPADTFEHLNAECQLLS